SPGEALDLRGEVCPFTFVKTRLRLEALAPGSTLWVVVDYEPASRNIPRSAREWGQDVLSVHEVRPGIWRIGLRKQVA
ncbi:MAG TPA: sulfurtransferase TusA family protein, partial [Kofleriaceae bacterium]|nr:sulfurtransferase TusA family protein [Kofleriaceae bacterium]